MAVVRLVLRLANGYKTGAIYCDIKKGNAKASEIINVLSLDVFNFNMTGDTLKILTHSHCSSIILYLHKFCGVSIIDYTNTARDLCR